MDAWRPVAVFLAASGGFWLLLAWVDTVRPMIRTQVPNTTDFAIALRSLGLTVQEATESIARFHQAFSLADTARLAKRMSGVVGHPCLAELTPGGRFFNHTIVSNDVFDDEVRVRFQDAPEIVDTPDACYYRRWKRLQARDIKPGDCIGWAVPRRVVQLTNDPKHRMTIVTFEKGDTAAFRWNTEVSKVTWELIG